MRAKTSVDPVKKKVLRIVPVYLYVKKGLSVLFYLHSQMFLHGKDLATFMKKALTHLL